MTEKPLLEVCLSPALLHLYDTRSTIVVVIDIFRATSTIATALDNGAARVLPVASVEECIRLGVEAENRITGGERDGQVAPGLQYGNSPFDYPPAFIKDKELALTTTNGTKLLHMLQETDTIITGSFLNLDAVCNYLLKRGQKVLLACAAWKDRVNMEDTLFAGAVVDRLQAHFAINCDSAQIAHALFLQGQHSLIDFLKPSSHYKRLTSFGLEKDMSYCLELNQHNVVPLYDGEALITEPQ